MALDIITEPVLKDWMVGYSFILVQDIKSLEEIIDKAIKSGFCSFDLESTGLDTRVFNGVCKSHVVGYSISFEDKIGYYIPIRHKVEVDKGFNLPPEEVNPLIQKLLLSCDIVGHNWLKYDAEILLASENIVIQKEIPGKKYPYEDTYVLARLAGFLNSGLKGLSKELLGKEMLELRDVVYDEDDGTKNYDFSSISPYEGLHYAASDAICTREIFYQERLQTVKTEQKIVYGIEVKLLKCVRKLERNKVKLNLDFCHQLDKQLRDSIDFLEKSIYQMVSEKTNGDIRKFQLDSPEEVSKILFDIFDMNPKPEKAKKGFYLTNDEVLMTLVDKYPLAKKIQDYRTDTKFHRTYIKNMLLNVDEEGYLKFNFAPLKTDSGRFASPGRDKEGMGKDGYSGVNIQSTPARYDTSKPNVRKCFSCESDEVIAALDWSGVELRVAANLSKEPIWLERFISGDGDLHTSTASIIYEVPESRVDKQQRQFGKMFNFQTVYGGGPGALATAINSTIEDARDKQQKYFGRLKGLNKWIKDTQNKALKDHFCKTAFGRKRLLPEMASDMPKMISSGKRKAINTPVQGSAADLLKLAMIEIDRYLEANNLEDKVQMLITMHDELVFRIKKTHVGVVHKLAEIMKLESYLKSLKWEVPLQIDCEIGSSWDVDYQIDDMLEFIKEKKGWSSLEDIYKPEVDYSALMKEYKAFLKEKKEKKAAKEQPSTEKTSSELKNDFKDFGNSVKSKDVLSDVLLTKEKLPEKVLIKEESEVVSSENKPATADDIKEAFKIISEINLGDLPPEAYLKLKTSFYKREAERLLSGAPSEDDRDVTFPIIVHAPLDSAKKLTLGYIIDSCPGNAKIKFLTENREELHEDWLELDILKVVIMAKVLNL